MSYPAYTRIPVVFDTVIDHHPTGNTHTGVFPQMDEGLAGLNVGYYGLYDAATGGNLIEFGQLEENGQPTTETISPNRTLTMSVNSVWFGTMQNVPCRPAPCGGCVDACWPFMVFTRLFRVVDVCTWMAPGMVIDAYQVQLAAERLQTRGQIR